MTALIKGLVQVRDGLSLIAFLSLVLLVAFRTTKVPELFFGLVRDKLSRQEFSVLLRRFMIMGFTAFLVLVALAVLAQVLNHLTQPNALTIDDLRRELAKTINTEDQKIHAEAQYKLAIDNLNQRDFAAAISALQESIKAVPTLTAQELLLNLYGQTRDFASKSAAWEVAMKTARKNGDSLALVRLDRSGAPRAIPDAEGEHDLIGNSTPLPMGGNKYENAVRISPGFYGCAKADGCFWWWYRVYLHTGQRLDVKFRNPIGGGSLAGIAVYGTNGEPVAGAGDNPDTMRGNASAGGTVSKVTWTAMASGWYFLRIGGDRSAVYHLQIA